MPPYVPGVTPPPWGWPLIIIIIIIIIISASFWYNVKKTEKVKR